MKYATFILLGMCVFIFFLQTAIPGLTDAFVLDQDSWQQPWRFITSIFLHGSLEHLIFNMFALLIFGFMLERVIGSNKFTIIFILSGIFANLIAVNFYPASLGASGAIYGILGALTILRPKMAVWVYSLPMPMFVAAIIWILIGIFGIFMPGNTGHIAHLSGIAIGFIFGIFLRKHFAEIKKNNKIEIPEHYANAWEYAYMRR